MAVFTTTTIIGALLAIGFTSFLAVAISHIIYPITLGVAVLSALLAFNYLERTGLTDILPSDMANLVLNIGLSGLAGFIVYRVFAWVVGIASFTVVVGIVAVALVGGLPLLFSVLGKLIDLLQ